MFARSPSLPNARPQRRPAGRAARWLSAAVLAAACLLPAAATAAADYSLTFVANGLAAWSLTQVSSADVFPDALPADNPALFLQTGKRYGITADQAATHPFAIIAKGAAALDDVVLLVQGTTPGSLEADAGIAWSEGTAGRMEFTVTPALLAAATAGGRHLGYRCNVHAATMRGDCTVYGTGQPRADPIPPKIPKGSLHVYLAPLVSGLTAPMGFQDPDDGTGRLFIYDQSGFILNLRSDRVTSSTFLDVRSRLVPLAPFYDERGLLGFALHPAFKTNKKIYTYTSEPAVGPADFTTGDAVTQDHQSVLAEWKVSATNSQAIDPASRREILRIDQPQFNHNGGQIAFGPDGKLYVSLGDGGNADDQGPGHSPQGNGQDFLRVYGKILRIDADTTDSLNGRYGIPDDNPFVGQPAVLPEIFAGGLRNPYRFSFDPAGRLIVADVGQNSVEEVDIVAAGDNCGWRLKEGTFFFDPNGAGDGFATDVPVEPVPGGLVDPAAQYDHDEGSAIVGGFVYRGPDPRLRGYYVAGDFDSSGFVEPSGRLFYVDLAAGLIQEFHVGPDDGTSGLWLRGFAEDRAGNLYVCGSKDLGPAGTSGVVAQIRLSGPAAAARWTLYE